MKQTLYKSCVSLAVLSVASLALPAFATSAFAADSAQPAAGQDTRGQDTLADIVVTASTGTRSKLDSSVSVSSIDARVIQDFHPMSEGDMLRLLPGIQPNVSGPGGNGNFAVRGLPVATGGSPFVQLQEDGLPMVLYGDIQFGNNDYFTKSSPADERVEAIRGGTAATLASQAPGAVVNYISKTSRSEGGFIELDKGVNYDMTTVKFLDSGIINDSMYFNVGGFYDVGHGPRHASYDVSNSYQIKGNITKELAGDKGFIRLLFKVADTREPNDPGGLISGNISGGVASNLGTVPGFNIKNQSNYSIFNRNVSYVDFNSGGLTSVPLNGITTQEKAVQLQLHYKFDNGLTFDDNGRYQNISGGFASNFFSISPLSGLIGSTVNGSVVASAVYAAGPNAGQNVAESYYNSNVEVYTHIRDEGGFVNDTKLNWKGDVGSGARLNITAGWFYQSQNIAMDWHPNQFRSQASGNNPAPIDLYDASGNLLSANGYSGYNNNWGACCARTYDYTFTDNAPYADLILDVGKFELDASIRHDINHGSGSGVNSSGVAHTYAQTVIDPVTKQSTTVNVPYFLPDGAAEAINYSVPTTSWSVGASYKAADNLNLFVRASKGVRFNADRLTFGGNFNADGTLAAASNALATDTVYQYEIGLKNRGNIGAAHYTAELTVYHSHFGVFTYELNPNVCQPINQQDTCPISDKYKTTGVEFYGTLRYGGLSVLANATYNKADKQPGATQSNPNPAFSRSNGIPDLSYSLAANYAIAPQASVGVDVAGVTSTLSSAGVVFPGSAVFGANVKFNPLPNLQVGLNVYNLFNSLALQGPDNANEIVTGNNFVGTASSAIGRTVTGSVKFSF